MRIKLLLLLFWIYGLTSAQITGKVTDTEGTPLPYVSISIENTYIGTSTNEDGNYSLDIKKKGSYTVVFRSLGYKTQTLIVQISNFPHQLDCRLEFQSYTLEEIVISNQENPADRIIRQAIKNRKKNSEKTDKYKADFYSKGIFRVKDLPKKILGQKIDLDDFGMGLDSTRSGILYLSETMSEITVQKPGKLKEHIKASKISGDDRGFSYNTAMGSDIDFYDNYTDFGANMISPIADNAFAYYHYKIENVFNDKNQHTVYKIKISPKRDKEPVYEGFIYIVDESYAIYAIELDIKGYRVGQPFLERLTIVQNYDYNSDNDRWTKSLQTFDFEAGVFGITFNGKFTHFFSNYHFIEAFDKKTFGREVISFEPLANKKDDVFWQTYRPIPLSNEELKDYIKKDSIQTLRKSKTYLDSLDQKNNTFDILDLVTGYTYKNSYKKWQISYSGISDIGSTSFNTVQGWNFFSGLRFTKNNEDKGSYTRIGSRFNYGLSDDRLRLTGYFYHLFDRQHYTFISILGGSKVSQFNESDPISPFINTISTLFFKDNYIKLYDKAFIKAIYGQDFINGLNIRTSIEYAHRKPLFNTTDYVLIQNKSKDYLSNNPLNPTDDNLPPFSENHIYKAGIEARIRFGQTYISRPDSRINLPNEDYPSLLLSYQKGFSASHSTLNYDFIGASINHDRTLGNKGTLGAMLKGGMFFGADQIAFIDYKHFNGNQTHIGTNSWYLNQYLLLPYYTKSTNDRFMELHLEHHFRGYIMNKIPLLNHLQWQLILGYHTLAIPSNAPYSEFSAGFGNLGFGKFRMFRFDYVRSYNGSTYGNDGIMIGLNAFLN